MDQNGKTPRFTLNMQSGATYTTGANFSDITFGTIESGSNFIYTGTSATFSGSAGSSRTYGSLNLQASNISGWAPGSLNTTGSLIVGLNIIWGADSNTNQTWSVGSGGTGDILVFSGATFRLNNAGNGETATATFNIAGGLINDGTINKNSAGTTATTINFNGTGSSDVKWGSVSTGGFGSVTVNIGSSKTITFLDSVNLGAAMFNVNGTLNIGSNVLSGTSGTFTLANGATLITSNASGLNGAITVTGTKSFSTAANYEFQGAATGSLLPSTVNNLTINRSSGNVTLDGSSAVQTISGALNVYSGNLAAGATTKTVNAGSLNMRSAQINSGLTIALGGDVSFDATNNGTATVAGDLNLGGASRTFTVADGTSATDMSVSGTISNGSIVKAGLGTLSLSGDNSAWNGGAMINSGTLTAAHEKALGTGTTTVNSGGTLAIADGIGLVTSAKVALNHGTLLGGSDSKFAGTLSGSGTLGSLTLTSQAVIEWSLSNPENPGTANQFTLAGALTIDGAAIQITGVSPSNTGFWATPQSWSLIASSDGHVLTMTSTLGKVVDSNRNEYSSPFGSFRAEIIDGGVTLNWAPIPEPSTYALLIGGTALVWVAVRRRRVLAPRS